MASPKLTIPQVKKIKQTMHNGANAHDVAKKYDLNVSTVRSIHRGRYYKNVLPELTRKARKFRWITPSIRVQVLNALTRGMTYRAIGKKFDMHQHIISGIKKGR